MQDMLLAAINQGGYFSIAKIVPYIALFYVWILLINWVHIDIQAVRTKAKYWQSVIVSAGLVGFIVWLFIPIYIVGLLIYLLVVATPTILYIIHRNSLVADFEKVCTTGHLQRIFSKEEKRLEKSSKGLEFITSNDNEVPIPDPKSREAVGFRLACSVFADIIWRRAENIKMQPAKDKYATTFEIDGMLNKQEPFEKEDVDELMYFLKEIANLDKKEKRKPQTGKFTIAKDGVKSRWEITTAGSTVGEHIEIKRSVEFSAMSFKDMGLGKKQIEEINTLKETKGYLYIVSGPKHSGVTMTLYSLLKNHDRFLNSIVTIEKHPSGEIENVTQEVYSLSESSTLTYDQKLLNMSRLGPDIIAVGECENTETAKIAAQVVKSGKTVYLALEANSCIDALIKWIKLVEDKDLAIDKLKGIINPRLVRALCDECKEGYQPNPGTLKKLNIPADKIKVLYRQGEIEYARNGKPLLCEKCQGTGYYGRTGIYESVLLTDEAKQLIKKAKTPQELQAIFRKCNMLMMQEQAIKKVAKGVTSVNEMVRSLSNGQKNGSKSVSE